jgi:hypothetical protein
MSLSRRSLLTHMGSAVTAAATGAAVFAPVIAPVIASSATPPDLLAAFLELTPLEREVLCYVLQLDERMQIAVRDFLAVIARSRTAKEG